ncbi:MAG: hypothetical protein LBS89_03375 [Zoogloeaceae bacterium]|jgi:hypothetical protein|nr:hypothetical protein [Zoogloeaceae bacterium]
MKRQKVWRMQVHGNGAIYCWLSLPKDWNAARIAHEYRKILVALLNIEYITPTEGQEWLGIAQKMPKELRGILIDELKAGNCFSRIEIANWPHKGSIVVALPKRFQKSSRNYSPQTFWRDLNDPHYCTEEIAQTVEGIHIC